MKERHLCCICCLLLLWFAAAGMMRGRTEEDELPAAAGQTVTLCGTVYRQEFKKTAQQIYLKDISIISDGAASLPGTRGYDKKIIVYMKQAQKVDIGNHVLVSGICRYPKTRRNPGSFDAKSYYHSMGIGMTLQKGVLLQKDSARKPLADALSDIRMFARRQLERAGEDTDAGILSAMLLGDKGLLDSEIKELYRDTGIIHLLAISGLHVSLSGMALFHLLRRIGLSFGGAGAVSGAVMAAYAGMTGFPVSAVRAVMMFALYLLAQWKGRSIDLPTSLAVSAAAILMGNNGALFEAGFLLSFGAVGGIVLTSVWKSRLLKKTAFGVNISVQLMTLPLTAYYYYQLPLYAMPLNLLVVWLMPLVLGFGAVGMTAAVFSLEAGRLFMAPAHYLLAVIEFLCAKVRLLPFARAVTGCIPPIALFLYYIFFFGFLYLAGKCEKRLKNCRIFAKKSKIDLIKLTFAIILLTGVLIPRRSGDFSLTFLDVGQGDGCCIINENRTVWMIDGGSSDESSLADYCVEPFLKSMAVSTVDYWMISHYDKDHISALLEILNSYEKGLDGKNAAGITVKNLLLPAGAKESEAAKELQRLAGQHEIAVHYLKKGDVYQDGNMKVRVLAPLPEVHYENSNAASMVALITYKQFSALFTGDVEKEGEAILLAEGLMDVDVLKAAHHGSKNSTSQDFLKAASPELTVISCGRENAYGHPHAELLERLREAKSSVMRTDLSGAITIKVTEKGYQAEGYVGFEQGARQ